MKKFLGKDFLLQTEEAQNLYHTYAADCPIVDFHCHLPVADIAKDRLFKNLAEIWLAGDHYKWRAMRAYGVPETHCSGKAPDRDKFLAWAKTVPATLRNPLYHWTHLELKFPFDITGKLLNEKTAGEIWDACNEKLAQPQFSTRGLLKQFKVEIVCTTDDPADDLKHHAELRKESAFKVFPTFRPDAVMVPGGNRAGFYAWIKRLEQASSVYIGDLDGFLDALEQRHQAFHDMGCRLSDHGLETCPYAEVHERVVARVFDKLMSGKNVNHDELEAWRFFVLDTVAGLNRRKGWAMQLHLGAARNNNTKLFRGLGPDVGGDSIGDFPQMAGLRKFLDALNTNDRLPNMVLYNLNPGDNEVFASMLGNFQSEKVSLQYGSAWWFLDTLDGMTRQIETLSNLGLLSRFVGMVTDSRSFLSYSRHDYFRRLLCNIIGSDVAAGLLPADFELLGNMVQDIAHRNARRFFGFPQEG